MTEEVKKCFRCNKPATRDISIGISLAKGHFRSFGKSTPVCDEWPDCLIIEVEYEGFQTEEDE